MAKKKWKGIFAVIAGGGTGGHVYPALAIADALVAGGHERSSIHFCGSRRGIEARVVPELDYEITLLSGRGIARKPTLDNVGAVAGLLAGLVRAFILLIRLRPCVVVSVGGYAAAPCAIAAVILRVPLVLAESNAVPGAVNRLVSRFAAASAVAIDGTPLPRAVVTGNPVRPEIVAVEPSVAARRRLGIPSDRVVVGVFGGSLGALSVNRAVAGLCELWNERTDIAIYHVVGRRDWAEGSSFERPQPEGGLWYCCVEYEARMPDLYASADALVCRSGATTVAEVAAVGVPAVFVPFPGATADHQTANARALEKVGAAKLIPDGLVSGLALAEVLEPIVADVALRQQMGVAAKSLARTDAAARVAEVVESHASPAA